MYLDILSIAAHAWICQCATGSVSCVCESHKKRKLSNIAYIPTARHMMQLLFGKGKVIIINSCLLDVKS